MLVIDFGFASAFAAITDSTSFSFNSWWFCSNPMDFFNWSAILDQRWFFTTEDMKMYFFDDFRSNYFQNMSSTWFKWLRIVKFIFDFSLNCNFSAKRPERDVQLHQHSTICWLSIFIRTFNAWLIVNIFPPLNLLSMIEICK